MVREGDFKMVGRFKWVFVQPFYAKFKKNEVAALDDTPRFLLLFLPEKNGRSDVFLPIHVVVILARRCNFYWCFFFFVVVVVVFGFRVVIVVVRCAAVFRVFFV